MYIQVHIYINIVQCLTASVSMHHGFPGGSLLYSARESCVKYVPMLLWQPKLPLNDTASNEVRRLVPIFHEVPSINRILIVCVFHGATVKNAVFWDVTPYGCCENDVSEERVASTIRMKRIRHVALKRRFSQEVHGVTS
jgi:hypothetical protein